MDAIERLRELVRVGDPHGTVTIAWLSEILEDESSDVRAADTDPDDFTVAQLAARFGRSVSTVHDWIKRRGLRAFRLGRELRVTGQELERWMNEQRAGAEQPARAKRSKKRADLGSWRHVKAAS